MARKKTKAKGSKSVDANSEIFGIILITIGVLILLSIFSTIFSSSNSISGMIGNFINHLLFAILGIGAYLSPFLILFIGVCYIVKKGKINFSKKFHGIILFIINTLLFIEMLTLNNYYIKGNFLLGINKIYNSKSVLHGGIISYFIDVPMYTLFGAVGSCIIFIAIYVICLILILKVSLNDTFLYLKGKFIFKKLTNKNDSKELYIENNDKQEELTISNEGKNKFIKDISNKIKIIDFIKSNEIETDAEVSNEDETSNGSKSDNSRFKSKTHR